MTETPLKCGEFISLMSKVDFWRFGDSFTVLLSYTLSCPWNLLSFLTPLEAWVYGQNFNQNCTSKRVLQLSTFFQIFGIKTPDRSLGQEKHKMCIFKCFVKKKLAQYLISESSTLWIIKNGRFKFHLSFISTKILWLNHILLMSFLNWHWCLSLCLSWISQKSVFLGVNTKLFDNTELGFL